LQDFANPEIAKHMHFYPEIAAELGAAPVSEIWEARRWREHDASSLTPMIAKGAQHFYVNEVAEVDVGRYVVPRAWVTINGHLHGECTDIEVDNTVRMYPISDNGLERR
jgi:hypothetical protein